MCFQLAVQLSESARIFTIYNDNATYNFFMTYEKHKLALIANF